MSTLKITGYEWRMKTSIFRATVKDRIVSNLILYLQQPFLDYYYLFFWIDYDFDIYSFFTTI